LIKIVVFPVATSCSLVGWDQYFGGRCIYLW